MFDIPVVYDSIQRLVIRRSLNRNSLSTLESTGDETEQ